MHMPNTENTFSLGNDLSLYHAAVKVLEEKFFDTHWRENILPSQAALHEPSTTDLDAQRCATRELLAQIPASHVALLSHHS